MWPQENGVWQHKFGILVNRRIRLIEVGISDVLVYNNNTVLASYPDLLMFFMFHREKMEMPGQSRDVI